MKRNIPKIQACFLFNVLMIQAAYDVDEIMSFRMAEQITAEKLGWC